MGSWACVGILLCGVCCMGSTIVTGVKQGVILWSMGFEPLELGLR